jgi:hypothetical protein
MMEAVRTSETSVDNHSTRQYNPEDSSEHQKEITHQLPVLQPPLSHCFFRASEMLYLLPSFNIFENNLSYQIPTLMKCQISCGQYNTMH